MTDVVTDAVAQLVALWPRLQTATGLRGAGQPSHKSRPPATLSVVSLVVDITLAAREGAQDLANHVDPDTPTNLELIAGALIERPDPDLVDWWTSATIEWTHRARIVLGIVRELPRWVHGARCPSCRAMVATHRQDGETWAIPAIGVTWAECGDDQWEVTALHCRACGGTWARGTDLDQLVVTMLANQALPILAVN